jgi:hypothetical protein
LRDFKEDPPIGLRLTQRLDALVLQDDDAMVALSDRMRSNAAWVRPFTNIPTFEVVQAGRITSRELDLTFVPYRPVDYTFDLRRPYART